MKTEICDCGCREEAHISLGFCEFCKKQCVELTKAFLTEDGFKFKPVKKKGKKMQLNKHDLQRLYGNPRR